MEKKRNYYLIPIFVILTIIPLVIRFHIVETGMSSYEWFSAEDTQIDMSLYVRNILYCITGAVMLCLTAFIMIRRKTWEKSQNYGYLAERTGKSGLFAWIPLIVYAGMAVISSITSEYSYFAVHGTYGIYQTIFTLLAYGITAYYAYVVIGTEKDVRYIVRSLLIGMIIICLIGISQFAYHDIFETEFGQSLIMPSKYVGQGILDYHKEGNQVYTTLFNSNYVGSYAVLTAPLLVILMFLSIKKVIKNRRTGSSFEAGSGSNREQKEGTEKDRGIKHAASTEKLTWKDYAVAAGSILLLAALMLCLFGSQSRTGIVVVLFLLILLVLFFRKRIFQNKKAGIIIVVGGLCLAAGGLFAANQVSGGVLFNRLSSIFRSEQETYDLTDIQTNDDNVTFVYKGEKLVIQFAMKDPEDEHAYRLKDGEGNEVAYKREAEDSSYYRILDERFPEFYLSMINFNDEYYGFMAVNNQKQWIFSNQNPDGDGSYYFCSNSKFLKLEAAESMDLFKDSFINNRGYIWNHTIPLLKDTLLLGTGANTFAFDFPNNDYLGLYNAGHNGEYIDKPHNMYLQTAVETGGLSLLAFLVFYFIYLVQGIRLYWKHSMEGYLPAIGAAILIGSIGYMLIGLVNDSMVMTAPVYWCLLGVGFAINRMVGKEEKNVE